MFRISLPCEPSRLCHIILQGVTKRCIRRYSANAKLITLGILFLQYCQGCSDERRQSPAGARTSAVVAAIGEPASVLPPLVTETVGRDIGDLVYQRLADLRPGMSPIDPGAFEPSLADRWERIDSVTGDFTWPPALAGPTVARSRRRTSGFRSRHSATL
jgi:hypothetical protein